MYDTKVKPPKRQLETVIGFIAGLNTFQDQTVLKDSELTEAKNIVLQVDGVEPRYGTLNYGNDASDSKVYGLFPFYKSDGTIQFLRISGARLKYLNGTSWSTVGSVAFANSNTNMIQVRDKILFFNGSDNLRTYDGSTVTEFTALTTPVGLGITVTGSAGSTAYSYRVSAFNGQGETLACTAVAVANGNATLSTTNYNKLDWTATSGATGYNIWGNKATGLGWTYMATVYTNTYNDTGVDLPDLNILPPEGNSSAGIKGTMACYSSAQSRVYVAGDPNNPSRIYWGGQGDNFLNFSVSENTGGGLADIMKNDGARIEAIIPFQGGVIIGKTNAIYKLSWDADGVLLEEITRSFGMISSRGIKQVENDLIFPARKDGRVAFYSLGNVENFSSSILRTNELSIKISEDLEDVNLSRLGYSASFYFRNIYGCAVATSGSSVNDRIWCLDTRFGAWYQWDDLSANCFSDFIDSSGNQNLFYGNESNGYVTQMFMEDRNDNGSPISVQFATKSFNSKLFHKMKRYRNPTFQFKGINKSGEINVDFITDGNVSEDTFNIQLSNLGGAGFGAMLFGSTIFGEATGGTPSDTVSSDQPVQQNSIYRCRSIKYRFRSSGTNLYYKFLALNHDVEVLETRLNQNFINY